jgi:hypothetical protein
MSDDVVDDDSIAEFLFLEDFARAVIAVLPSKKGKL